MWTVTMAVRRWNPALEAGCGHAAMRRTTPQASSTMWWTNKATAVEKHSDSRPMAVKASIKPSRSSICHQRVIGECHATHVRCLTRVSLMCRHWKIRLFIRAPGSRKWQAMKSTQQCTKAFTWIDLILPGSDACCHFACQDAHVPFCAMNVSMFNNCVLLNNIVNKNSRISC